MTTQSPNTIQIALYGFDDRSTKRMERLFLINFKGKCSISDAETADVALIDLEGIKASGLVSLSDFDPATSVILSDFPDQSDQYRILTKPPKLDSLWQALEAASSGAAAEQSSPPANAGVNIEPAASQLKSRFASTKEQSEPSLRPMGQSRSFRAEDYFYSWFNSQIEAAPTNGGITIQTWDGHMIIVYPPENLVMTDLREAQLRNLTMTPLPDHLRQQARVTQLHNSPRDNDDLGLNKKRLDQLLWELAYNTSRGKLPEGADIDQKHQLKHWPNFTRLCPMENGMRMASVWARAPRTIDEIATDLNIPLEQVYAFYAAAHSIGLIEQHDIVGDTTAPAAAAAAERSNPMLSSFLRHVSSFFQARRGEAMESSVEGEA